MMLRCRNLKEAAIAVNRRGARTQDEMGARPPSRASPTFRRRATSGAMVSVSWADRSAIIERQREGVMLAFGNQ
jgi:hypothetical protein